MNDTARSTRYAVLAAATVALAMAGYLGYLGYVLFPRFDLPSLTGATLLILAPAGGVASFFSPCSFPLFAGDRPRQACPGPASRPRPPAVLCRARK